MSESENNRAESGGRSAAHKQRESIGLSEDLRRRLAVRYARLTFELEFLEDGRLPAYKSSALRGGMGEMLLNAFCFRDRNCNRCDFEEECTVRRIMYARYPQRPEFVTSGESIGYLISCEDYREAVSEGDTLTFTLTLFGRLIVYLNPILQAFSALGQAGLGKHHTRFIVRRVINSRKENLVENNWVYWEKYKVETLAEYVDYRIKHLVGLGGHTRTAACCDGNSDQEVRERQVPEDFRIPNLRIRLITPVSLKHNGAILEDLDLEVLMDALVRRLYMLDMFEGIETREQRDFELPTGRIIKSIPSVVPRFSSTHGRQIRLHGVRGEVEIDTICMDAVAVLLAGEVMHVGKNVSMGFGKIRLDWGR